MFWHVSHSAWITGQWTILATTFLIGVQIAHCACLQGNQKDRRDNIRLATHRVDGLGTQRVCNDAVGTIIQLHIREGARAGL